MRLKNKKTGEIGKPRIAYQEIYIDTENKMTHCYKSLQGVFEEWEVYEEPKDYWFIRDDGSAVGYSPIGNSTVAKRREAIGNYFETKEEAEKALEKLKAWKRLKDKGFRFVEHQIHGMTEDGEGDGCAYFEFDEQLDKADLDLLFGGEE